MKFDVWKPKLHSYKNEVFTSFQRYMQSILWQGFSRDTRIKSQKDAWKMACRNRQDNPLWFHSWLIPDACSSLQSLPEPFSSISSQTKHNAYCRKWLLPSPYLISVRPGCLVLPVVEGCHLGMSHNPIQCSWIKWIGPPGS